VYFNTVTNSEHTKFITELAAKSTNPRVKFLVADYQGKVDRTRVFFKEMNLWAWFNLAAPTEEKGKGKEFEKEKERGKDREKTKDKREMVQLDEDESSAAELVTKNKKEIEDLTKAIEGGHFIKIVDSLVTTSVSALKSLAEALADTTTTTATSTTTITGMNNN